MLTIFDPLRGMGFGAVLLRMVCAFLCGLAIGLERSYHNKPAGFRTHILVCLGACIASMTGYNRTEFFPAFFASQRSNKFFLSSFFFNKHFIDSVPISK